MPFNKNNTCCSASLTKLRLSIDDQTKLSMTGKSKRNLKSCQLNCQGALVRHLLRPDSTCSPHVFQSGLLLELSDFKLLYFCIFLLIFVWKLMRYFNIIFMNVIFLKLLSHYCIHICFAQKCFLSVTM